ncbi:MAG: hypothetical protein HQK90_01885 [Nitrospirae bacterium]|nr:hypothetical protein [Nitrospirota bacterium]
MKKRLVFTLALALAVIALKISIPTVSAGDNVTYTLPFLGIHTNSVVYCFATNMSADNVTVGVSIMSNSISSTDTSQEIAMLGGMKIFARTTDMITFTGATATLGSAVADFAAYTGTDSGTIYGANITFLGSYNGVTTAIVTSALSTIFGPQTNTNMSLSNGHPTVPISCLTIGLACYQGTTSPKRNLVGYTCMDSINTNIKPYSY